MGSEVKAATSEQVVRFGSKSVNNLPLMFEVVCQSQTGSTMTINYKSPVAPLKPLLEGCLRNLFGKRG